MALPLIRANNKELIAMERVPSTRITNRMASKSAKNKSVPFVLPRD